MPEVDLVYQMYTTCPSRTMRSSCRCSACLRNYSDGYYGYKAGVWERHDATALYDGPKWTYMMRPSIPLPKVV